MKIGLSSYSISQAINAGEFDLIGAIRWVAENGGEHIEISPPCGSFDLTDKNNVELVKKTAAECGIELSSYTIGANFLTGGEDAHDLSAEELAAELRKQDIFMIPLGDGANAGLRVALCALPEEKISGMAAKIKAAMEVVGA